MFGAAVQDQIADASTSRNTYGVITSTWAKISQLKLPFDAHQRKQPQQRHAQHQVRNDDRRQEQTIEEIAGRETRNALSPALPAPQSASPTSRPRSQNQAVVERVDKVSTLEHRAKPAQGKIRGRANSGVFRGESDEANHHQRRQHESHHQGMEQQGKGPFLDMTSYPNDFL